MTRFRKLCCPCILILVFAASATAQIDSLVEAVRRGVLEDIRKVLDSGVDVNARDADGNTALMWAAGEDLPPEVTALLLSRGADINQVKEGFTALTFAARYGTRPETIRILGEAGSDPNFHNSKGWTPLHFAARNNPNPGMCAALLRAGADPDSVTSEGFFPLYLACVAGGNRNALSDLVGAVEYVDVRKNPEGLTSLMAAARETGNSEIFKLLVAAGADVNAATADNWKPLHFAARFNREPEIVATLVALGAEVNSPAGKDLTPLHMACIESPSPGVVRALLRAGADVDARDRIHGATPLMLAAANAENVEVLVEMINAGAMVRDFDALGWIPLMWAVYDNDGPGKQEILRYLIEEGLKPDSWKREDAGTVRIVAGPGPYLDWQNADGDTALMLAAQACVEPFVFDLLLAAGADTTLKNRKGKTACDLARANPKLAGTPIPALLKPRKR